MKQPRVPEYREGEGFARYMRTLVLFLKDFAMDVWQSVTAMEKRVKALEDANKG